MTSPQTQAEANKAIIRRYREAHNTNNMDAMVQLGLMPAPGQQQ